jgi:hypothetical protein
MRMHICPRRSTESYATVAFGLLCLAPVAVWLNLSDEEIGVRPCGRRATRERIEGCADSEERGPTPWLDLSSHVDACGPSSRV